MLRLGQSIQEWANFTWSILEYLDPNDAVCNDLEPGMIAMITSAF